MASGTFVGYYRVSTEKQGRSGLGLEAQQASVQAYLNGGDWTLAAEVIEIESGKRSDRPKLTEALRLCRLYGAKLIVAKIDRLSRNVAFLAALQDSGVQFVAVDMPEANELTVHIMVSVAQAEGKAISKRTKDALQAAKARGAVLGGFRGKVPTEQHRASAIAAKQARASARASDLAPTIAQLRAEGITSLNGIARALTEKKIPTARGAATWSPAQVARVLEVA